MAERVLQLINFGGGLNTAVPPALIDASESPRLRNIVFDKVGLLEKRKGYEKFNEASLGEAPITGLYRYNKRDGTKVWLVAHGQDLSWMDDKGVSKGKLIDGLLTDGTVKRFATFKDQALVADKTAGVYKTDLTTTAKIDAAPKGVFLVVHHERVFVAGTSDKPSTLYWSEDGDEETWEANSFLNFDQDDGDEITGLCPLFGDLVVFKRNSIHVLYGAFPREFSRRKVHEGIGCIAPDSILPADNGIYFCASDGIKFFDGAGVHHLSAKVDDIYRAITRKNAVATAKYKQHVWFVHSHPDSNVNDKVLVLDAKQGRWTYFDNIMANVLAVGKSEDEDVLLFGSSAANGHCYVFDRGYSDDGEPIAMEWHSKTFTLDSPEVVKRFRNMYVDFLADGSTAYIDYIVDRGVASGTLEVTGISGDVWGEFKWGEGIWQEPTAQFKATSLDAKNTGRYIRFVVRNRDTQKPFRLYSISVVARPIRMAY